MSSRQVYTAAVTDALASCELADRDLGAAQVALGYAHELDRGGDLARYGPLLLVALESLGMTPRARAAITGKGAPADGGTANPLDELRARRASRAN